MVFVNLYNACTVILYQSNNKVVLQLCKVTTRPQAPLKSWEWPGVKASAAMYTILSRATCI